jgi:hypothetical protein
LKCGVDRISNIFLKLCTSTNEDVLKWVLHFGL